MGLETKTYVGAYVNVTKNKFDTIVSRQICNNLSCVNHNNEVISKFCPECGKKTKHVKVNIEVNFSLYKLEEKYQLEENMFYIPEDYNCILPQFEGNTFYDTGEVNIIKTLPLSGTDLFLDDKWTKLIKALEKELIPFELCFGTISYWS